MKKRHVLLLFLVSVSLLSAKPPQDNAGRDLVGAWRLVSVEGTDATFHFAYDHPTGIITYDQSGWMTVQIYIKGIRKPFINGPAAGTVEEKVDAFDNCIAYYGPYTVNWKEQTITRHGASHVTIQHSIWPADCRLSICVVELLTEFLAGFCELGEWNKLASWGV